MKVKIIIGQSQAIATIYDNPTSKDFLSLLPITLTLIDYNRTEKISDLPKKISTKSAPDGYKPNAGDITIYAPWGNLALFYRDFGYSKGLISLGRMDSGLDLFKSTGPLQIKIERL